MITRLTRSTCCFVAALGLLAAGAAPARAETLKLEVQLLWGTNDAQSPDRDYKPVDADIEKDVQAFIDVHRAPLNPPEWDWAARESF